MLLSRLRYYLVSIPRILGGFRNWPTVLSLFLGMRRSGPVQLTLRETGLLLQVRSALEAWLVKEVCIDRQYEAASLPIQDGWTVIDIGGGIGEFALDVAHRFPAARVLVFEPAPDSFRLLNENIALNRLENVQAWPSAVAATAGPIGLQRRSGQGALTAAVPAGAGPTAPAVTLADILQANALPRVDFLKIDCEGCEFGVLRSASGETLARFQVICLEYHDRLSGQDHRELQGHLERNGFRVSTFPDPVQRDQGLIAATRRR